MTVELISVGTEILLGNIVNTNAAWLSEQCARLGLSCYYQSVVGDNAVRLKEQIQQALNRSDIVILTGGLGPTTDDLTKETAAQLMGKGLVMDMHSLERVEAYFKARRIEMTENNKKQALCPEGAMVLDNDNGTAPGLILEENGKRMILLPGPPNELHPLFEQQVKPYLQKLSPEIFYSRTVKLCGIGESKAAAMIQDMIDAQTNPTIAPYAKTGEVHLRVTARAKDEQEGKKLVKPVIRELKKRFGEMVYTTKEERTLEEAVVKLLKKNKMSITCAESCTGGLLAGRIVNVAGASSVFQTGKRRHAKFPFAPKPDGCRQPDERRADWNDRQHADGKGDGLRRACGGEGRRRGIDHRNRRTRRRNGTQASRTGLYRLQRAGTYDRAGISIFWKP